MKLRVCRNTIILVLVMIAAISITACGGNKSNKNTIRVGSKDFTESLVVAEVYALALEDAGYQVERNMNIAGSVIHASITNDEIDLYPEYTGTGLLAILKMDLITDPEEVYQTVKDEYDKQFSITWLDQTQANDSNGLVIRTDLAQEYGIYTVSDLQKHADKIRLASQGEFEYREDGIPGLEKVYGKFNFKSITLYDNGLKYKILENDEADVAPAYTTEGQLTNTDLFTLLQDDKHFWPPYYLAPIIRNEVLEENPDIADILNKVSATLDTETVTMLNAKVDVDQLEYEEVAEDFYLSIK
ncbi:MAG: glycine betaine ABC transporter substrate-binding protein [Lachnospiraceae bacterium]|nr:glycine betaine ABC transporter substrate-binding protein [Lachnospiraceae bacterium]